MTRIQPYTSKRALVTFMTLTETELMFSVYCESAYMARRWMKQFEEYRAVLYPTLTCSVASPHNYEFVDSNTKRRLTIHLAFREHGSELRGTGRVINLHLAAHDQ